MPSTQQNPNRFPQFLVTLLLVAFFAILWKLTMSEVPPGNKDLLNIMIGVLGTSTVGAIGFFYTSNAAAAQRNELISHMATMLGNSQPQTIPVDASTATAAATAPAA